MVRSRTRGSGSGQARDAAFRRREARELQAIVRAIKLRDAPRARVRSCGATSSGTLSWRSGRRAADRRTVREANRMSVARQSGVTVMDALEDPADCQLRTHPEIRRSNERV